MNTAAATNRTPHYICPPELLPEPALISGENPAVWDQFRAEMLATLSPGSFWFPKLRACEREGTSR